MDIASKKLSLFERLHLIWDEAALERVARAIERELPVQGTTDDYSDAEVEELDRRMEEHVNGLGKGYTHEEAMRLMREGFAG